MNNILEELNSDKPYDIYKLITIINNNVPFNLNILIVMKSLSIKYNMNTIANLEYTDIFKHYGMIFDLENINNPYNMKTIHDIIDLYIKNTINYDIHEILNIKEVRLYILDINVILDEIKPYIGFYITKHNIIYNEKLNTEEITNDDNSIFMFYFDINKILENAKNNNHKEYLNNYFKYNTIKYSLYSIFGCTPYYANIYYFFNKLHIYFPDHLFEKYKNIISNKNKEIINETEYIKNLY